VFARSLRRGALAGCSALALGCAAVSAMADDLPDPETAIWAKVKRSLFEDRPVQESAAGIVELDAPARAEDAAVVPIAIRTKLEQTPGRYIKRIYLIVDNNPSPLAATFDLGVASGRADLETRIRVDQYTWVRAVAELSDGTLAVDRRYVKASGGCSAASGKDAGAMARLGRMRLAAEQGAYNEVTRAQIMISHPNDSGLAMDQVTRLYPPAYFVRTLEVTYAGTPVLSAELDFSISENPYFRFYFVPTQAGELKARAVDTKGLTFETTLEVRRDASRAVR
jgi:sulfur-oxidizing protein SoxY